MAQENAEYNLVLTESVEEAAQHILKQGYAIHILDETASKAVSRAREAAHLFFQNDKDEKFQFQKIVKGSLYGYNVPSSAKELYRAWFGGNDVSSTQQPWPNQEFKEASQQVAETLDELLYNCVHSINTIISNQMREKQQQQNVKGGRPSNPKKHKTDWETISSIATSDSSDTTTTTLCPLDYFLYHGQEPTVNCSEHVDRGILICVCLDPHVAGLEVCSSREFVCPEEVVMRWKQKSIIPSSDRAIVCIMAGNQLKETVVCGTPTQGSSTDACGHRVRQELAGERLSITYELRTA